MPNNYEIFMTQPIPKGNRNNMLFRAFLIAMASEFPLEPVIERGKQIGLSDWEIQATLTSAKRINLNNANLYSRLYSPINKDKYLNEFGKQFSERDMLVFFRTQINRMFNPNEFICIAELVKSQKFTYEIVSYDSIFSNNFVIPNNAVIKINPINGNGMKESDVVAYRYVVVESDKLPVDEQLEKLKESNLPIDFVIHSGNKSLHGLVRVDAESKEDYYNKVAIIKDHLTNVGFQPDTQVMRASSFCRLAGSYRNNIPQYIVEDRIGAKNFNEFLYTRKFYKTPKIFSLSSIENIDRKETEPIIEGLLRKKWKMILSGDPKIGKTFLLLQLTCAFSSGGYWLERKCEQQKVLFVNAEVDNELIMERINAMRKYYDVNANNIFIVNMRGLNMRFDEFFDFLDSKESDNILEKVDVIIVDPIYKIFGGDENSQREVTRFFSYVDDRILSRNKTFIFSHHHNKGDGKGFSRTSGSSVFVREPDAIVDVYKCKFNIINIRYDIRGFENNNEYFEFDYPMHVRTAKPKDIDKETVK